MIDSLLWHHNTWHGDVSVVVTDTQVKQQIESLGIHCFLLQQKPMTIRERDSLFAQTMMPGLFGDDVFPDTQLKQYEVLALDRLKFWFDHSAGYNLDFIDSLNWQCAVVSLDLDNPYPLAVCRMAQRRASDTIAVKTKSVRTKEFIDSVELLRVVNHYVVESEDDKAFLRKLNIEGSITIRESARTGEKEVGYPEKETLRKGMGISPNERVVGVFFDKRDEWQCREYLKQLEADRVFIFPVDERSDQLLIPCIMPYVNAVNINVYTDRALLSACDEVVSFRWDDGYCNDVPELKVVDNQDINLSTILVPDGIDVI